MRNRLAFHAAILVIGCAVLSATGQGGGVPQTQPAAAPTGLPYADDPEIVKLLDGLGEHSSLLLPPVKVTGVGIEGDKQFSQHGPSGRDYCNKMAYAPDRQAAMFAGANHGAPSRLNDCWEYHLGSNTWVRLAVGDGGDHGAVRRASDAVKKGQDVEKNEAFLKKWYSQNVVLREGYLQTKVNGGPVSPWHTWDALAYDAAAKKLLWAVLDTDAVMAGKVAEYAKWTGQDFDTLKAQLKPGTGLYLFDPATDRWHRQLGPDPRPYLRGMGGSLVYVPDWKKTVWYCAAQNVSPNDFAMWAYDAVGNKWEDLKPNGGRSIRELVFTDKIAPAGEVQMAYSPKDHKIVAVSGKDAWAYDLAANAWSHVVTDERNYAHDAVTIFDYDSAADAFLLINSPKGHWGNEREVRALRLATGKWETLPVNGPGIDKRPYSRQTGYYDPTHNVFVVYASHPRIWVYRCKPREDGGR